MLKLCCTWGFCLLALALVTRPTVADEQPLKGVKVPEGFTATLFAGPPNVTYPTCVAAAPTSEVFIGVDENGSLGKEKTRRQNIVRCVDEDGDGRADKFNLFAENVGSVRGMFYHEGKLWVLHPPLLRLFHDDDRDGKADREETLVEGLGTEQLARRGADHCTNGFGVGIDGWIYIAVGDFGFVEAKGSDGSTAQLYGGGIARVRMDGSELEIYARNTRNIYDVAVSPEMELFTRDNTNDGGGWNVRLSHIIQTGEYGYPRLFKNFAEDIVQPLADYGGGSPTGALYIDETSLPGDYADALYTCDWGKNVVYRHPLMQVKDQGAGFAAEQQPFIQLPRPTDMDIDPAGNIYVTSWKDGQFAYKGDHVGFVVRVKPSDDDAKQRAIKFPNLRQATPDELLKHLASGSHVVRLHTQLEILRRGNKDNIADRVGELASSDAALPVRVAALYTYKQLRGEDARGSLAHWVKDDQLRQHAVRALADRQGELDGVDARDIQPAIISKSGSDRLAAAVALGRLARRKNVPQLAALASDTDALVAHAAINGLVAIGDAEACWEAYDTDKRHEIAIALLKALRQMHSSEAVTGILSRLPETQNRDLRGAMLTALCRLAYTEAEYTGGWWGTRPDTRGPYYKPTAWSETDRILAALKQEAESGQARFVAHLRTELPRHRINTKGWKLADDNQVDLTKMLDRKELDEKEIALLAAAALDAKQAPSLRARAMRTLQLQEVKAAQQAAFDAALAFGDAADQVELQVARLQYIFDPASVAAIELLQSHAAGDDVKKQELALASLMALADIASASEHARQSAAKFVGEAWAQPRMIRPLMQAVAITASRSYSEDLAKAKEHSDEAVRRQASEVAKRLHDDGPAIKTLKYEAAVAAVLREQGDAAAGARMFVRRRCIACHTASPDEQPIGPYLGGIAKRYKPADLAESILRPSAKVAQGFATQQFITVDGKIITGFVVTERADALEIRDAEGKTIKLAVEDIDERITQPQSIMPDGLADEMTPRDLAALMAFLGKLREK